MDIEGFDDSVYAYYALSYASKKAIPDQIVHSIHIQLGGYQLMQKLFLILSCEYVYGHTELTVKLLV